MADGEGRSTQRRVVIVHRRRGIGVWGGRASWLCLAAVGGRLIAWTRQHAPLPSSPRFTRMGAAWGAASGVVGGMGGGTGDVGRYGGRVVFSQIASRGGSWGELGGAAAGGLFVDKALPTQPSPSAPPPWTYMYVCTFN